MNSMKKYCVLFLLLSLSALAQNARYSASFPSVSSTTTTPFLIANVPPNSPIISVCNSPAVVNASGACVNYATTYTSLGVACSNGAQDTPDPQPSACQSTGDAQGNIGFWAPPGTYTYTVCLPNSTRCFGPYTVTLGGGGGGGGGGVPTGVANGSQLVSSGVAQPPVYQVKPVIDVRDYGVIGNAIADDTTALQNAVNAACGTPYTGRSGGLKIPNGMVINVSATINITGCQGLTFDGGGNGGAAPFYTTIQWAGAAASTVPVLYINRTRDSTFKNFNVGTQKSAGANATTIGIQVDEGASGSGITTHNHFENIRVYNVDILSGFRGWVIGAIAPGNVEDMTFENTGVGCAGVAPVSTTSNGTAYALGGTLAEPYYTYFHNTEINGCSLGWDIVSTSLVIIDGGLTESTYYVLYHESGSLIKIQNIRDEFSVFFAGMLANAGTLVADNLSLSGLTPGATSFDMTNAGSPAQLTVSNTIWDNVAMTPISPNRGGSSSTYLFHNTYPVGACPNLSLFAGESWDLFSHQNGISTPCPLTMNVFPDSVAPVILGVTSLGGAVRNSAFNEFCGSYQNGGSTFAPDCWIWQVLLGTGTNGTTTLALTHSGSSGAQLLDLSAIPTAKVNLLQTLAATSVLSTSSIGANTCVVAGTATITGLTTSSLVKWDWASTPIGVTGYGVGALQPSTFATTNTANVVVCNITAAPITPGAMSVNLRGEL